MNIKKLKELIQNLPDEMEVILQKDAEGNGYSPLEDGDTDCIYIPDSTYSGEIKDTTWTADEASEDPEEWEEMCKKPRILLLYPVN